jgi:glycine/D-amino acid oxidase-like deaminating enzyme
MPPLLLLPLLLLLEPALSAELAAASSHAQLFPLEGWCDPDEATRSFLQDAQQFGATVLFEHKVSMATAAFSPGPVRVVLQSSSAAQLPAGCTAAGGAGAV